MNPLFPAGKVIITPNAAKIGEHVSLQSLVERHTAGDWGDVDEDDITENNLALKEGRQVWSRYKTEHGTIWIATQGDRKETGVMTTSDY